MFSIICLTHFSDPSPIAEHPNRSSYICICIPQYFGIKAAFAKAAHYSRRVLMEAAFIQYGLRNFFFCYWLHNS